MRVGGVYICVCVYIYLYMYAKIWFHPTYSFGHSQYFLVEMVLAVSMLVSVPAVGVEPHVMMVPAPGEIAAPAGHLPACIYVGNCS